MPIGDNGPIYTKLDASQIIQQSFDEQNDRLRVDAEVTAVISGPFEVAIDDTTDSIKIGDGSGTYLGINSDKSINVRILDSNGSAIILGQQTKAQSIPVVLPTDQDIVATIPPDTIIGTIEAGTVDTAYNEVTSVVNGALTTIVSYMAVITTRLKAVEVTGTNIATYTVLVNGDVINKKRTYYGNLDNDFQFSKGYHLNTSDVVSVQVLHTQPDPGNFSGFILVLKDD